MQQPLVTILLPCYNAMPYLPMALESILNQTYQNLDILCINDGSTDETAQVLEEYAKKDTRIRVVHNEENIKLIRTLNKGLDLATGRYIARMDADDMSLPNRIEKCIDFLEKNNEIHLVTSANSFITEDGKEIFHNYRFCSTSLGLKYAHFLYNAVGHPTIVARKELFKNIRYKYDKNVLHTEDYEIWAKALQKGFQFHNINEVLYQFRINSQSVSHKFEDIQNKNFIYQANHYLSVYLGQEIPIELNKSFNNRIDNSSTFQDVKKGIKLLAGFTQYFLSEEKPDIITKKEINSAYRMHKLDIYIQAIKRLPKKNSFSIFIMSCPLFITTFFKKKERNYLLNKFKK